MSRSSGTAWQTVSSCWPIRMEAQLLPSLRAMFRTAGQVPLA
jgi:hypothetical protein